jgi:hypothetical protein
MRPTAFIALLTFLIAGCAPTDTQPTASTAAGVAGVLGSLSEREERLIYSRAYEAILWASPALAIIAMDESAERDLGAGNTDIVYSAMPMDHRWELITYNNQSPYWNAAFSVEDGPRSVPKLKRRIFGEMSAL